MNAKLWKEFLLTRKIELFLSSDSIEGPEFDWGYCCQRVRLGGASPEPELWPPSRLQLALLRRNQTQAPAGKYFSTISEIIWRAENMRGHLYWERSLVSTCIQSDGGHLNIFSAQCNHRHSWSQAARADGGVTDRVQNLFTSAPTKMRPTRLFVAMCANLHFAKCKTHFV